MDCLEELFLFLSTLPDKFRGDYGLDRFLSSNFLNWLFGVDLGAGIADKVVSGGRSGGSGIGGWVLLMLEKKFLSLHRLSNIPGLSIFVVDDVNKLLLPGIAL